MILEIYSSYGKLVAEPMTLQAIEKSILPEHANDKQVSEVVVGDGPADAVYCEESGKSTGFVDYPTDQ